MDIKRKMMRICGRNTSTPPTPASTPSTNSARIHAGAEARNAETPSERDGYKRQVVSRVIYTIVGIAGLWCISLLFRERHNVREGE